MHYVLGAPSHPQTQGKIERWHQTLVRKYFPNLACGADGCVYGVDPPAPSLPVGPSGGVAVPGSAAVLIGLRAANP